MRDVARRAGVSIATVSRVVNGSPNVSEETRKKVLKAIKETGYKPLPSSRQKNQLMRTIGILVPDLLGYHYSEIVMAIEEFAYEHRFDLMLAAPRGLPAKEEEILDEYFRRKIDGVIVCEFNTGEEYLERFIKSGVPVVALDYFIDEIHIDSVNIDNIQGAYSALRYLYNKGHRKVLYVRGPSHIAASLEREKGIKKFLNRHPDMEVFIPDKWGGFNPEDGYRQIKEHLRKYGKNFTAIFVVNDYSTLGVYEALMESGLEIPDDVSVLGFDDAPFSKYIYPPLTTVAQPRWEMGTTAAQLLIDRISTQKVKVPRNVVLPTRIVERKSVKELKT